MSTFERSIELYYGLDALCRAGIEVTIKRGPSQHVLLAKTPHAASRRKRITSASVYTVVQKAVAELLPDADRTAKGDVGVKDLAKWSAESLLQLCNYYGGSDTLAGEMDEALRKAHRTIQQSFMSAVKLVIERYGSRALQGVYDERNRASSEWARDVLSLNESRGQSGYGFPRI